MFHAPAQTFDADAIYRFRLPLLKSVPTGDVQRLVGYVHEFGLGKARARVSGEDWALLLTSEDDYHMVILHFWGMVDQGALSAGWSPLKAYE